MKVLAFDFGATSGRAILAQFDGKKITLEETHRFPSDPVMVNGTYTWDILRLFHELKTGIVKTVNAGHKDIDCIGIDTWGVDFGLISKDGKLLGNPVHYRDARTDGMIEEACKSVPADEIYGITGIQFQKFNTLYQLLAMKKSNDPLLDIADKMLFVPDLFNYLLTGKKYAEYTITSTSQMYDPIKGDWAYGLLEKLGIDTKILPEVIPAGTVIGTLSKEICDELDVSPIPVVAVAEHDTGSAVVSVPFFEKGAAYLSSGTWSLLGLELDTPIINKQTQELNYTNEGGINKTVRLLKNIMGLWINTECMRYWEKHGEPVTYKELADGALASKPFASLIDVDDQRFFEPFDMPKKIQDYCRETNQPMPQTKGEFSRCIMESLALKYREAIDGLGEVVGNRIPALNVVGGGCQNKLLCQFTANAINRPVVAGPIEATAIGNICTQLIAMKAVNNLDEAREVVKSSFPLEIYMPQDAKAWDEAYEKLRKISGKA